mmetsp:Transcript_9685/g.14828  ORF Transcript_9685/g.14828 Transcript_9685/m.14828 type:complete len:607 (+) Transcript_9685:76-1896(+)
MKKLENNKELMENEYYVVGDSDDEHEKDYPCGDDFVCDDYENSGNDDCARRRSISDGLDTFSYNEGDDRETFEEVVLRSVKAQVPRTVSICKAGNADPLKAVPRTQDCRLSIDCSPVTSTTTRWATSPDSDYKSESVRKDVKLPGDNYPSLDDCDFDDGLKQYLRSIMIRMARPVAQAVKQDLEFVRVQRLKLLNEEEVVETSVRKTLAEILEENDRLHMISLDDRDMIMFLAEKNDWRIEDIIDGVGIDANEALKKLRLKKPEHGDFEIELRKKAVFRELLTLLLSGAVLRTKDRKRKKDVQHRHKVHLLVDNKYNNQTGEDVFQKVKVRGVMNGKTEREGIDFMPWQVPTTMVSRRAMILTHMVALRRGKKPYRLDVDEAFLRTIIDAEDDEEYLIDALPGYIGLEPDEIMAALAKLYGSHKAPRLFQKDYGGVLDSVGLRSIDFSEPEVRMDKPGNIDESMLVSHHVDDSEWNIPDKREKDYLEMRRIIERRFPLSESKNDETLGIVTDWHFDDENWENNYCERSIVQYIVDAAYEHQVIGMRMSRVPMSQDFKKVAKVDDDEEVRPDVPYCQLMGKLVWIGRCQHLCILGYVNALSQYNKKT